MKKQFSLILAGLLCLACLLVACGNPDAPSSGNPDAPLNGHGSTGTQAAEARTVSPDSSEQSPQPDGEFDPFWDVPPTAEERDAKGLWNIEIKFESYTEDGILLTIYDYDNLGFTNDVRYKLEMKEGDDWTQVLILKDAYGMVSYAVPQPEPDCIHLPAICVIPKDFKLASGHYRVTKVLSDREFSTEFDLNV